MSIPNNKKIWESRRRNGTDSSWNKGLKHSLETREKIKEARKRQIISEEHKKKVSMANKGKIVSLETRKRMSESRRGERSYNWKGGTHNLMKLIRQTFQYRQWRSDCFTRDDFNCQMCPQRSGKLQVDHIKPFSMIVSENNIKTVEQALMCEELWNINNGRTLCINCHRKTDTWGYKTVILLRNML